MALALAGALWTGVLIAIQATIIGAFGERLNPFVSAVWVHVGGLAFGVVVVLLVPRLGFELAAVRAAPWGLLAGVCGVLLVTGLALAISGLGLGTALAIVTGVQLLGAFAIDASGILGTSVPLDLRRVLGALVIVAGVLLVYGGTEA